MADVDLVVIGSGPAGEKGAVHAALHGKRVVVVEREPVPGGTAANTGTLPSKTLRETSLYLTNFRQRGLYGVETQLSRQATVKDFLYRERKVREFERQRILDNLSRHGVELVRGRGTVADAHTVVVTHEGAPERRLTTQAILVATGSSPFRPPLYPFEHTRIHDSDELLDINVLPHALTVVGGGVIGCEYACMFAALGIPVTLVDSKTELLPFLDNEFSALLLQRMEALGVRMRLGRTVEAVEAPPEGELKTPVRLKLSGGETLEADQVLVAAGRSSNTAGMGLDTVGVKLSTRGLVEVGPEYQTAVPGIYAVGDVIGFPALASTSMEQARIAVTHAFQLEKVEHMSQVLPFGIYTIPEVSMAGETEEALVAKGTPYVVGRAHFATNARGQIIGDDHGVLKLLFHRDDMKLLGVHVLGEQASELVHVGLLALMMGAGANLFVETCFNYPTLSEVYKTATYEALQTARVRPTTGR